MTIVQRGTERSVIDYYGKLMIVDNGQVDRWQSLGHFR